MRRHHRLPRRGWRFGTGSDRGGGCHLEGGGAESGPSGRGALQPAQAVQSDGALLVCAGAELLDLPDNRLDSLYRLDLIKRIEERIALQQPQMVNVNHAGDVIVNHRCLLRYEVVSSTEWQPPASPTPFQPKLFVDVTALWPRKRHALEAYSDQMMRPWPYARSIEAPQHLAHWRGAQESLEAAEAFCLLRQVA